MTEARLSAAAAARATGVARSTIQRRLKAGDFPHATETDSGWGIPISDLLRAGYRLDTDHNGHPLPGGHANQVQHGQSQPENETVPEHAHVQEQNNGNDTRVQRLEAELLQVKHALDMERLRREAAEQLAAERDRLIEVLSRHALAAPAETLSETLTESDSETPPETLSVRVSNTPPSAPTLTNGAATGHPTEPSSPTPQRGRFRRFFDRF